MRKPFVLAASLVTALLFAFPAAATTWYVSPIGTASSGCTTRDDTCSLDSAASGAVAGDVVILMDGVYKTALNVVNSGTASAWITFKADDCSTPIIEGPGAAPTDDNKDTGIGSPTATYLRFDGIVARGWNTGFGNGWTGNHTPDSNGYWDIENCIGDMNGRTGFTFFSAPSIKLKHSISAHNGSSATHSWSSGVTLFASPAGVIEANVSFENMDAQKHTDGSGFIADKSSHGASFVNNLAFLNGGSCLRLTDSNSVVFANNTCYHDAQDVAATGPTDPDEVYFTNAPSDMTTITSISFVNNVLVALGSGAGLKASNYTPTDGWSSNVTSTATVTYFTASDGDSPDFSVAAGAGALLGTGTTGSGVPSDDLGFDPRCIVKKAPTMIGMMATGSWWHYSIDYDYIKSIGGVAKCFNPKARAGAPDIGSYANGAVTRATPNSCRPATPGAGVVGAGGMPVGGSASGGTLSAAGGSGSGVSGSGAATTSPSASTASPNAAAANPNAAASCSCHIPTESSRRASLTGFATGFGLLGLGLSSLRARRSRSRASVSRTTK